jgi:hypothetical protein
MLLFGSMNSGQELSLNAFLEHPIAEEDHDLMQGCATTIVALSGRVHIILFSEMDAY